MRMNTNHVGIRTCRNRRENSLDNFSSPGIIPRMSETYSKPTTMLLQHLDEFTEDELIHLDRLIVERLRLMHQVKAHRAMTQFRVGQRVQFGSSSGRVVTGILAKYNRKSVTVVTEQGESWTVAPTLLQPAS